MFNNNIHVDRSVVPPCKPANVIIQSDAVCLSGLYVHWVSIRLQN